MHNNAGLLRFVQRDYEGALAEFEAAAAADPTDAAAVNNAAICQLFITQVGALQHRVTSPTQCSIMLRAFAALQLSVGSDRAVKQAKWGLPLHPQAHTAVHELQTAVRERPAALLTDGCAATLSRLYELGPPGGVATAKRRLAEFAAGAGPQGLHLVTSSA